MSTLPFSGFGNLAINSNTRLKPFGNLGNPFLVCPYAQLCWNSTGIQTQAIWEPFEILEHLRRQIAEPFFMEVIILMSWSIWTSQNNFIFKNETFSDQKTKEIFIREFAMVIHRAKSMYFPNILQWLESLI